MVKWHLIFLQTIEKTLIILCKLRRILILLNKKGHVELCLPAFKDFQVGFY